VLDEELEQDTEQFIGSTQAHVQTPDTSSAIRIDGDEDILPADKHKFPETNDKKFPQENKLTGLRSVKVSLEALFGPPCQGGSR
jgi:hypothetical protein